MTQYFVISTTNEELYLKTTGVQFKHLKICIKEKQMIKGSFSNKAVSNYLVSKMSLNFT